MSASFSRKPASRLNSVTELSFTHASCATRVPSLAVEGVAEEEGVGGGKEGGGTGSASGGPRSAMRKGLSSKRRSSVSEYLASSPSGLPREEEEEDGPRGKSCGCFWELLVRK